MTNPNCEYGANFVGIHTLAQWAKCRIDGTKPHSAANEAVSGNKNTFTTLLLFPNPIDIYSTT